MKFDIGDILYSCDRWKDGKFHIGIVEVVNGAPKIDKAGRDRGWWYEIHAKNFVLDWKKDFKVKEAELDTAYYRSAVEAVGSGLAHLFDSYRRDTPESRMIESLYGKKPNVGLTIEVLPKVVRELQEFQQMFAEAANLDAKDIEAEAEGISTQPHTNTPKGKDL